MSDKSDITVTRGSGNVFADLGLPDAEVHFQKAQIVSELYHLTKARRLTMTEAGKPIGLSARKMARLFKGDFREISVETLTGFLDAFRATIA